MTGFARSVMTLSIVVSLGWSVAGAQTTGGGSAAPPSQRGATRPQPAPGAASAATRKIEANLLQLMRGMMYPASNVVFAAQGDLSKFPPAPDPAVSPNPLTTTYGGWQ